MKYLILADASAARARSRLAADVLPGIPGPGGVTLWGAIDLTDGRCALRIPDVPADCGISLSQAEYDALLTSGERAALVDEIPPDLIPPSFP